MANLIRVDTQEYPISVQEFKNRHPNVSFPDPIPFSDFGYAVVFDTPVPATTRIEIARETAPLYVTDHYEQQWEVVDITTDMTEEELNTLRDTIKLEKNAQVDSLYLTNLYTNVVATFPAGDKTIQFLDEFDRMNLTNSVQGAMALVLGGQGTTEVVYRTLDNATQTLTATQMVTIGMAVLASKQAIFNAKWAKKDVLAAITTVAGAVAFDPAS